MIASRPTQIATGELAQHVRGQDIRFFAILGVVMWAIGTVVYRVAGPLFFEASAPIYWLNVLITAVAFCVALRIVLRVRRVAPGAWVGAALAFALPGMAGEVVVLAKFSDIMIRMRAETAGRYAAYLFAGYTAFILFASFTARRDTAKTEVFHP